MSSRSARRAQTVASEGVGALVDVGDESFVVCDVGHWNTSSLIDIRIERLEKRLGVRKFKTPKGVQSFNSNNFDIKFARFPRWLFCPSCRRMVVWQNNYEFKNQPPCCINPRCRKAHLVPMRFVIACQNGHLSDIPWDKWVHNFSSDSTCDGKNMRFYAGGRGTAGLESLSVQCFSCNKRRTLAGITAKDSMKDHFDCPGTQPWMNSAGNESCDQPALVLQRGASNIYYSKTESALDISTGKQDNSEENLTEKIRNCAQYKSILDFWDEEEKDSPIIEKLLLAVEKKCSCDRAAILKVLDEDTGSDYVNDDKSKFSLLEEEWNYIIAIEADIKTRNFVGRKKNIRKEFSNLLESVVQIDRLREVRALAGYTRVNPPGDDSVIVSPVPDKTYDWLPGIEVFGEGIFIEFSEEAIGKWEQEYAAEIAARIKPIEERYYRLDLGFLPEISARFILLHSISHLLIRQLVHDSGYSGAALRERIYCTQSDENPMAGILIYTADSDSEGSMGGLARQGEPARLAEVMLSALVNGEWCSVDPICSELSGQGFAGLNRAACHACALVAETSCICSNVLLDRVLVTGQITEKTTTGFFSEWIAKFRDA